MSSIKIKAPYEFMESKQFKLFDFVPEFSEFRQFDDLSRFGCEILRIILSDWKKEVKYILRIELQFVHLVNHIMLLKMVLMNVNLFF